MKVALVDARRQARCTLKDVAGGFGTVFRVGDSWRARLLEAAKARVAALPNVQLAYLDALFHREGVESIVVQASGAGSLPPADLYLIASSIVDAGLEREVARAARRRFGATVGVFGAFAAAVPEHWAEDADFVVKGDIEALAPALSRGARPRGVVDAGFAPDLDALPFPRWDQFPIETFRYSLITSRGITLPVLGSRGCRYACDYCPYLVNAKYRTRGVDSLVEEISWLRRRHDVRGISFRDPLRVFEPDDAAAFAEGLLRSGADVRFSMECRTDRLDEELLDVLHRAGLRSLEIGIENADPRVVAERHRGPPAAERQERVVAHAHRLGIRVIANYLLGLPNDDEAGMRRTVEYAKRLNTFAVQFTVATPYPGTRLHDDVAEAIVERDWERFTGFENVFRHPTMSRDAIHALREQAYVGYHFRWAYAWRFLRGVLTAR